MHFPGEPLSSSETTPPLGEWNYQSSPPSAVTEPQQNEGCIFIDCMGKQCY